MKGEEVRTPKDRMMVEKIGKAVGILAGRTKEGVLGAFVVILGCFVTAAFSVGVFWGEMRGEIDDLREHINMLDSQSYKRDEAKFDHAMFSHQLQLVDQKVDAALRILEQGNP